MRDADGQPVTPSGIPLPEGSLLDARAVDAYDVDALMAEFSGPTEEDEAEESICLGVEDLFRSDSRFQLAIELAGFLEMRGLTATELLHRPAALRAFQRWPRRAAILEHVAQHQSARGRKAAHTRLDELRLLETALLAFADERQHKGAAPGFDAKSFASSVSNVFARGSAFDDRHVVDGWLIAWLGEGGNAELRMVRVLSLDSDALSPAGITILDQLVGEMLVNRTVISDMFKWLGDDEGQSVLSGTISCLARMWRGEHIADPRAPVVLRRLSAFIANRPADAIRQGLLISLRRLLSSNAPLARPNTTFGRVMAAHGHLPVSTDAVMEELAATAELGNRLMADDGLVGGDRTIRLLDQRVARQFTDERLEALFYGKSHMARIMDLLAFEGVVTGDISRRALITALQRHLERRDFAALIFETARTPRARIKALAELQRHFRASGLPEAMRERHAKMLDDVQNTYLRTNRILGRLARDRRPTVDEVLEFANLLAEGAFTEGKCATQARDLVGFQVRSTAFLRDFLARINDSSERRAEYFARFFATLKAAGLPILDMGSLRVLLADDEPAARGYIEMILRDLGIGEILLAEDGRQALSLFQSRSGDIDLIICDWKMPRMSGLEFLKLVRMRKPRMPFLMVTALATLIAVEEAMAHDVTAYIAKPFSPEQLEEKVLVLANRTATD